MPDRVGQQLGNYRLIRLLGHGGFADVYLGEHIYLKTHAAIKVLQVQLGDDEQNDFLEEARIIAHLVHPHIIRVLDFGVQANVPFLVMEYAPNGTLRERHPKGSQLPLSTILPYVKQVASALQYAHDQNLIHRDVKPGNMLLGAHNEVLLSDFGTALVAHSSQSQSTQETVGTIAYMAPEAIEGKPRPASDQYSLAVVVYEWLSGDRLFHGSLPELVTQQLAATPPLLHDKIPTISRDVEAAVMLALAKDPRERFATIQAFANALEQASREQPTFGVLHPISQTLPAQFSPPSPATRPPAQPPLVLPATPAPMQSTMAPQQMETRSQTYEEQPAPRRSTTKSSKRDRIYPAEQRRQAREASSGSSGMQQLIAMIIGLALYGGLSYFIDTLNLHGNPLAYRLYYIAIVIPLFFGVVYGPWFGVVTAVGGYLLGHYLAGSPSPWNNVLGIAITGFIAGLAMFKTRGNYNKFSSIAVAEFFGAMGIIVGEGFIDCSNIQLAQATIANAASDFFTFSFFGLLAGLILLPILLAIYNRIVEHRGQRQT